MQKTNHFDSLFARGIYDQYYRSATNKIHSSFALLTAVLGSSKAYKIAIAAAHTQKILNRLNPLISCILNALIVLSKVPTNSAGSVWLILSITDDD